MENENSKKSVLIIDDDSNLRTVLLDKFNASGFNAVGAASGEEGLKIALDIHPDVILLDVMMHEMNGWDVLENLRQDDWGKDAKVIMLTVLEDLESVSKGVEKNIAGYLVKTQWNLDDVVKKTKESL